MTENKRYITLFFHSKIWMYHPGSSRQFAKAHAQGWHWEWRRTNASMYRLFVSYRTPHPRLMPWPLPQGARLIWTLLPQWLSWIFSHQRKDLYTSQQTIKEVMRRLFCAGVVCATPSKISNQDKFYCLPKGSADTSASNTRVQLANTGRIGCASLVISAACQADWEI